MGKCVASQNEKIYLKNIADSFQVRFGYDPRKDFESRYYQQFDYRLRTQVGCKDLVDLKRTNKIHVPSTKPLKQLITDREIAKKQEIIYSPYFEIGSLPQSRQCKRFIDYVHDYVLIKLFVQVFTSTAISGCQRYKKC